MSSEEVLELSDEKALEEGEAHQEVINFPEDDITSLVEEYWEKETDQNILGNNSTDIRLKHWAEYLYCLSSFGVILANPPVGGTMATAYAVYKADNFRRVNKESNRIEEIENQIEERYFFDGSTDLAPIIENTEDFEGVGGSEKYSEMYQFVLDKAEDIPVEADINGYFKDTSQVLWMEDRGEDSFDYNLEIFYDGIPLFEINGRAEGDFSDILDKGEDPSKPELIFEYTDTSTIGSNDAISQIQDIKQRLTP